MPIQDQHQATTQYQLITPQVPNKVVKDSMVLESITATKLKYLRQIKGKPM